MTVIRERSREEERCLLSLFNFVTCFILNEYFLTKFSLIGKKIKFKR